MEDYQSAVLLLGLRDANLPVFKETRARRLQSIEKMGKLINVLKRLHPHSPRHMLTLDPTDPEWDDKMVFPTLSHRRLLGGLGYWGALTFFYVYNWNVFHSNIRLRLFAYLYPVLSVWFLSNTALYYFNTMKKVRLFDNYVDVRARELFEQNRFMLDHDSVKRLMWFDEDLQETLTRVHRQANNHDASDFKDSELILQDFIRRYSDPRNPDASIFWEDGRIKQLN